MDEFSELRDRLIALAGPPEPHDGSARILDVSAGRTLQTAFEEEIAQTRLPRQLVFQNSAGTRLALSAASGRILSLDDAALPDDAGIIFPLVLDEEDAESISLAAVLLSRFLAEAKKITVIAQLNCAAQDGMGLGISPVLLRTRAQRAGPETKQFDLFLSEIQSHCSAWMVIRDGEVAELEGSPGHKARLSQIADTLEDAEHGDAPGLHCVLLAPQDSKDVILCASETDALAFAVVPQAARYAMIESWQAL